ncbi:MAG: TMEM165/GDT1 family protein [Elusimicrobia bacterium]|nr:TMEM165/GDT1 family protein [Elusimicrobiota bacterium]
MDWKLFWLTFATIFLSELGDKTQLGVLSFSATSRSPLTIFLAASCALTLASFIGVLFGTLFSKFIHPKTLRIIGGILFIAIGCWILFKKDLG